MTTEGFILWAVIMFVIWLFVKGANDDDDNSPNHPAVSAG